MGGREIRRELNQRQTSGGYQVDGTSARVLEEQRPALHPRLLSMPVAPVVAPQKSAGG